MTATLLIIVQVTVAWRGISDPAATTGITTAQVGFATMAACLRAKPGVEHDGRMQGWTVSAICLENGK